MAVITGTEGDDKYPYGTELRGTNGDDRMCGLAGDDSLVGFDGDDLLEGGADADELWGGYGFDYASYQGSPEGVYVLLYSADGTDFGDAAGDRLYSVEGVVGSACDDFLLGDDGDNVLRGGGGNDMVGGLGGNDALYGEAGDDVLEGGAGDDVLEGGAGSDTACFVLGMNAGVVADLASGTAQGGYVGNDLLAGIENLQGSFRDDRVAGDKRANALEGAGGADMLEGRGGADRFVYGQDYDSRPAADRILDFSHKQGDRIDLRGVDADRQVTGDQTFTFIGQGQFNGVGQVRFFQQDGDTIIEANTTDATAGAEMRIVLDPLVSLQAGDFFL
jgi:Ca2+-binding RTX toxin-like protein